MNNIQNVNTLVFISEDNKIITTSKQIAELFGKRHSEVLRDIQNTINKTSIDFTERNFALSEYADKSGKLNKEYSLTKDGAVMLIMGYTGEKAMQFKEAYINAFNQMAETLQGKQLAANKCTSKIETANQQPKTPKSLPAFDTKAAANKLLISAIEIVSAQKNTSYSDEKNNADHKKRMLINLEIIKLLAPLELA